MTTEALRKPMVWTEMEGQRLNVPVKIWAEPEDLAPQSGAILQARDLAMHPTAFHHVALMPDFHQGFGMPIGGVFAAMNAVIPNAVGNDIFEWDGKVCRKCMAIRGGWSPYDDAWNEKAPRDIATEREFTYD